MTDVIVAIPTFHRTAQLRALLDALMPQASAVDARVIVIDNDPAGSAAAEAERVGAEYVVEPRRGLASVRNRAIDVASEHRSLVFIDDDELPADGWLEHLIACWRRTGSSVSGRVESRFPDGFYDAWIDAGGFFRRVAFGDGVRQSAAATNNLLLDLGTVRRLGLRFDERFGLSGGEDILFTTQLTRGGGSIVSCPAALVIDPVDPSRLRRTWVLARAYRVGVSAARVAAETEGLSGRMRVGVGGVGRVIVGAGRSVLGRVVGSTTHHARGARAARRGAGMVVGALGGDYREYARR